MQKAIKRSVLMAAIALLVMSVMEVPVQAAGYDDDHDKVAVPEYLYYIEGTGSYFLQGEDSDTFFNLGRWYRRSGESWSVSDDIDGPWSGITKNSLPRDLAELPADFQDTRNLGLIPYRYVVGPEKEDDDYPYRYYRGRYYDDYERHGYHRRWHPHGRFWFFVAPHFHDDDWDDSHRRRRRRRGRY